MELNPKRLSHDSNSKNYKNHQDRYQTLQGSLSANNITNKKPQKGWSSNQLKQYEWKLNTLAMIDVPKEFMSES